MCVPREIDKPDPACAVPSRVRGMRALSSGRRRPEESAAPGPPPLVHDWRPIASAWRRFQPGSRGDRPIPLPSPQGHRCTRGSGQRCRKRCHGGVAAGIWRWCRSAAGPRRGCHRVCLKCGLRPGERRKVRVLPLPATAGRRGSGRWPGVNCGAAPMIAAESF
jgi:hypothetical protein